jgi:hypothetical protein
MGSSTREDEAQGLIADARAALVKQWTPIRWDYWVDLKWRTAVSSETANAHLERLIADLHRPGLSGAKHPTIHLVAGFHADPFPHAHAMVALSRRHRMQFLNAAEFKDWLQLYWSHGPVWAEAFDVTKRSPEHGGAVEYLARDPGTVVFG